MHFAFLNLDATLVQCPQAACMHALFWDGAEDAGGSRSVSDLIPTSQQKSLF